MKFKSFIQSLYIMILVAPLSFSINAFAQTEDTTPPVLVDLHFIPTTIDVSSGDQIVTFTWALTDDLVGLAGYGYSSSPTQLRMRSPSGGQIHSRVLLN